MDMLLRIKLPEQEICIESKDSNAYAEIYKCKELEVVFEHSLYTISIWESMKHKAFLKEEKMSPKDFEDYIRCMIVKPKDISNEDFTRIIKDPKNLEAIRDYIYDKKTATCFFEGHGEQETHYGKKSEISTSEVIYYSIFSLRIPMEVEHWHLNKLMALLRVFDVKNPYKNNKRRSPKSIMQDYDAINAARRKKLGTKG